MWKTTSPLSNGAPAARSHERYGARRFVPRAMVADNDHAVGQLVETVSRSPYWKKTAILILEDDARKGFDHAHRSFALVISPFIRKKTRDSRIYNTDSVLRTMELLMGLHPMNQYDTITTPIAVFGPAAGNDGSYSAILPAKEIVAEVNESRACRAQDGARLLNPVEEESAPDEELNDIPRHGLKGKNTPTPMRRYSLRLNPNVKD
jgi:hypothetical protein